MSELLFIHAKHVHKLDITNTQFSVMFTFVQVIALLLITITNSCSDILLTTICYKTGSE